MNKTPETDSLAFEQNKTPETDSLAFEQNKTPETKSLAFEHSTAITFLLIFLGVKLTNDIQIRENRGLFRSRLGQNHLVEDDVVIRCSDDGHYVPDDVFVDAHAETITLVAGSPDAAYSNTCCSRCLPQAEVDGPSFPCKSPSFETRVIMPVSRYQPPFCSDTVAEQEEWLP